MLGWLKWNIHGSSLKLGDLLLLVFSIVITLDVVFIAAKSLSKTIILLVKRLAILEAIIHRFKRSYN